MSTLQDKYASVIEAAQNASLDNFKVQEQDGILYVSGEATNSSAKDAVWDALGKIDASYSASDINLDIKLAGLAAGSSLTVVTESTNLNIRQETSTESAIVGKVAKGDTVTLIEQTTAEWWKIKSADGTEGYVYSRYLRA